MSLTVTDSPAVWHVGGPSLQPVGVGRRVAFFRLPADWVTGGRLRPERRAMVLDAFCGTAWRGDHTKHLVLDVAERVLTDDEVARRPWRSAHDAYVWTRLGLVGVPPARL